MKLKTKTPKNVHVSDLTCGARIVRDYSPHSVFGGMRQFTPYVKSLTVHDNVSGVGRKPV